MQLNVTIPGQLNEPIIVADNATFIQFVRRVYEQTGAKLFGGFGYADVNGNSYLVPTESDISGGTCYDVTQSKSIGFSTYLIPAPVAPTVNKTGTGGSVAANTYYVVVTYVNPAGETVVSPQSSVTTTGTTSVITVTSPVAYADATQYKVYMGTTNGSGWTLQGSATNIGTTFTQSTTPSAGAAIPGSNTATSPVVDNTLISAMGFNTGDQLLFTSLLNTPAGS